MSAEFDSGGVLSRARPVLTFSRGASWGAVSPTTRPPVDATPAPVSWTGVQQQPPPVRRSNLPVIPRIVRRTRIEQGAVLGPLVRGASVVGRLGLGTLLFAALGLATLGTIAGLGVRSTTDEVTLPATTEARTFDATATERLLARAPLAPRAEHLAPAPRVDPPVSHPLPQPAAHAAALPVRHAPAPSRAFAAAHAAKKRPATTVLARR